MFQVAGSKPFERGSRNVWSPRVNDAGVVAFLTDKRQIWLASVHWRPREKRSVPCSGDASCPDCSHSIPIQKGYAAVLLYRGFLEHVQGQFKVPNLSGIYTSNQWTARTLEITRSIADLVDTARPGLLAMISRPGTRANDRCRAQVLHTTLQVPEGLVWDVRSSLVRCWESR